MVAPITLSGSAPIEQRFVVEGPKGSYRDYYYILGVSPEATSEEIRDAYQELHEKFGPHVNMNGQDATAMLKAYKDICEAYETLMNPDRRKEYDENNSPHLHKSNLRALWGKFTGGESGQDAPKKVAEDTVIETEITLSEAIKGTQRRVRIDELLPCTSCAGMKPVQRLQCPGCRGTGSIHNARHEDVEIPAGAYDKAEVRRPNLGKFDLRCGMHGDLVVEIRLRPHQFFNVMGRDLTCTVPVTILEAVLGGEIAVPTTSGKVIMRIQPLTQSGRVYRLKGLGLAGADLLVTIEVKVPTQISAEEVELFRKLQANSTIKNPRDELFAKLNGTQQP